MAKEYETLLRGMLEDWRRTLGNQELEFYIIQLPDYHNPHYFAPFNQWALIREAQNNVARHDPYADCIVTLGWGDVTELHPRNKKGVGEAAGRFAVARMNGHPLQPPQLQSMECRNQTLELTFSGSALPAAGTVIHGFTIYDWGICPIVSERDLKNWCFRIALLFYHKQKGKHHKTKYTVQP